MRIRISDNEEERLYYVICDIARTCKRYFYDRKYLPNDAWSIDDVIKEICYSSKELKTKYNDIKKIHKQQSK